MGASPLTSSLPIFFLLLLLISAQSPPQQQQQWCIARSGASEQALQAALDYACGKGISDCQSIQPNGLCYLPNTLQAHASFAFNSYFQRSRASAAACDFAGTATLTITDPSYGSCTFPSSASTAGGPTNSTTPNTNTPTTNPPPTTTITTTNPPPTTAPLTYAPPPPGLGSTSGGVVGGLTPNGGLTPTTGINPGSFGPTVPNTDFSGTSHIPVPLLLLSCCYVLPLLVPWN